MTNRSGMGRALAGSLAFAWFVSAIPPCAGQSSHRSVSGVYPHLAMFNEQNECGTGAVVPWADRLWVVTYGPHSPFGSSDKLYEIDRRLRQTIRPESVGGTPANRMIHRESQQLFLSHYAIDARRNVRVIPVEQMPGRLTAMARHLTDPARKVYYATMEEGFYEVDVDSLAVRELFPDGNVLVRAGKAKDLGSPLLPGYHGKGTYSGQGWLIYANNGERGREAQERPDIESGVLAQWDGKGDWQMVRRNQFTEVSGPGGIHGNARPDRDPVWSIGWDHRSLILMLLDGDKWHAFRLPKATHTYDGAHGWNTEWPRIREIGERDLLMTMHGTFWRFPANFSANRTAGIAPRSTYLKVVGDFCRWNDRVVLGCDDAAKSEFLNSRRLKNKDAGPGQSNSGLWFIRPSQLDQLGPAIGRGGVWLRDDVAAGEHSEPYLFSGYAQRMVHLTHDSPHAVTFDFEVDRRGNGKWETLRSLTVPARGYAWHIFAAKEKGAWLRITARQGAKSATVFFQYNNPDPRTPKADAKFASWPESPSQIHSAGTLWSLGEDRRVLGFAAVRSSANSVDDAGYYELDGDLRLRKKDDPQMHARVRQAAAPAAVIEVDAASVIVTDEENGPRYRLPKGGVDPAAFGGLGWPRVCREVVTERDLLNCAGTFYELPARNAGGLAKIRPVATHNRAIHDYASYRGMMVISGLADVRADSRDPHVIVSDDKQCALWVGVIDDLWKLGKPRGVGGPWKDTVVPRDQSSDPYLMTGYDRKSVRLSHQSASPVTFRLEVDLDGNGLWRPYQSFAVPDGKTVEHTFPAGFAAYWVRAVASAATTATVELIYE